MEAEAYWVLGVLAMSSLLNAAYFLPIIHAIWFKEQDQPWPKESPTLRLETHWMLLLPPLVTAFCAIAVGLFASTSFSPLAWSSLIAAREYQSIFPDISGIALNYNTDQVWILISPILLLAAMAFKNLRSTAIRLTPLAPLPALAAALFIVDEDFVERSFLLLTSVLWFIAALYAHSYAAKDKKRNRFYLFFILTMIGNLGVLLSQEISSFISFFALMSFSAYPLILHSESDEAKSAATTYIRWVIFGEIILFIALVGRTFYSEFGVDDRPIVWVTALLIIGFGVKAGFATLHVWLPKAHPVAPIPASAILSAAMVKVGLLGWIRFLPLGDEPIVVLAEPMMMLGFAAAFLAAIYGALQDNPKTVLAYSTVSQLGIISASIGFALAFPASWELLLPAIVFFAMHHGFAKATLFFCVGLNAELKPGSKFAPYFWLLVLIPALSLIGVPLSSGAFAKASLESATSSWPLFSTLMVISAIGTSLLMGRFIELMRHQATLGSLSAPVRWGLILPTALSAVMCLAYFYTTPAFELKSYQTLLSTLSWSALWPAFIGLFVIFVTPKLRAKVPVPFAGDLLIVYREVARLLLKSIRKIMAYSMAVAREISVLIDRSKVWSLSVSARSSKHLAFEAPGTITIVILAALIYSFLS